MAGEWLAIDIGLPDKPEVQELIDMTGQPVEYVCFRLYRLWSWAAVHCADGTARMTIPRLSRTCGGDDAFWRAVAAVGWLEIDETAATVAVPGWDRRFSQAAKARREVAERVREHRDRSAENKRLGLHANARETVLKRFGRQCVYCGAKEGQSMMGGRRVSLHVDHVVPIAAGGTNDDENLVPACKVCNLHKGDRRLEETSLDIRFLPEGFEVVVGNDGRVTGVTRPRYQRRGEERTGEHPPPPREAAQPDQAAWAKLRAAWNDGAGQEARRRPWKPLQPPDEAVGRLVEPGWLEEALEAIPRLRACRYFKTWVGLPQFCGKPAFVRKVLDGSYDDVNEPKIGPRGPDDRAPPRVDPSFEAARAATLAREQARREAEHRRLDELAAREAS